MEEIIGNLFDAPSGLPLVHCVGSDYPDLDYSRGIAQEFRERYGANISRNLIPGSIATLQGADRLIIHLITKWECRGTRPTYGSLSTCLMNLADYCVAHDLRELAMPQIGCGLDRLDWHIVQMYITRLLVGRGIKVKVYVLPE